MKTRNPKLGKFITAMNNEEAHEYIVGELNAVRLQAEEDRWCEIGNGEKVKKLTKEVVANTHDDVVEIRKATEIFIDLSSIYCTLKKYRKTRWMFTLTTLVLSGWKFFF
jgi:hypothetical protein